MTTVPPLPGLLAPGGGVGRWSVTELLAAGVALPAAEVARAAVSAEAVEAARAELLAARLIGSDLPERPTLDELRRGAELDLLRLGTHGAPGTVGYAAAGTVRLWGRAARDGAQAVVRVRVDGVAGPPPGAGGGPGRAAVAGGAANGDGAAAPAPAESAGANGTATAGGGGVAEVEVVTSAEAAAGIVEAAEGAEAGILTLSLVRAGERGKRQGRLRLHTTPPDGVTVFGAGSGLRRWQPVRLERAAAVAYLADVLVSVVGEAR